MKVTLIKGGESDNAKNRTNAVEIKSKRQSHDK
jgi:hypothetical protein